MKNSWLINTIITGMLLGSLLACWPATLVAADTGNKATAETRLKAAFLYKFCSYVAWPQEVFADVGTPLVIGVIGENQIARELEQVVIGRKVNGRSIEIKRYQLGDDVSAAQVLFLSRAAIAAAPGWSQRVLGKPILLVADRAPELEPGISINFVPVGGRLRFDVSLDTAKNQQLTISSQLLLVARTIKASD